MPSVSVLGAGVTGVATAWYLSQQGFDVTVIDRQHAPAQETSFANGGQISVCHATPWANPKTPLQVLKWLWQADAPLLYRLNGSSEQWRFIWRFLKECSAHRADKNLVQLVNLGLYSRHALMALEHELKLSFAQRHQGILHFYTNAKEFHACTAPTKRMNELGCDRQIISPSQAISLEPALKALGNRLLGATYTQSDLSGNARTFSQQLARHSAKQGVKFLYNTHINAICPDPKGQHISHISLSQNGQSFHQQTDAYVVCLASYGKALLDPLGVYLPIFPAKGYSATLNVKDPDRVPQVSLIDDEYKLVMSRLTNGDDVLRIAGTAEFNGYNTTLDNVRCQAITKRVKALFGDALFYDMPAYWTGLRPMTPSNVPLIGKAHKGNNRHGSTGLSFDNLWLNTGHGTLGFTHACGSAKALALLMTQQKPNLDFQFVGLGHSDTS